MGNRKLEIVRNPLEWKKLCQSLRAEGSLGFVPTMGALHAGHASLVERGLKENKNAVVSVFVNPTQFNDRDDFAKYPRVLDADAELLESLGARAVFAPLAEDMYPLGYRYRVSETGLSERLCGAFRPGHFDGMLTVVMKLLLLTAPTRAYFGEKDYQQYLLVRDMARDLFLDTAIIPCPIVREGSGLALSSRNARLTAEGKARAALLREAIADSASATIARERLERAGFNVDYVEDIDIEHGVASDRSRGSRRLAAAWLEGVRLIDNVAIGGEERA